jgi:hypothetical protein
LYDCGQDPKRDRASWQMPTSANPFILPEEIDYALQRDRLRARHMQPAPWSVRSTLPQPMINAPAGLLAAQLI